MSPSTPHTVVIGAGIGGLTAAALLLQAGHRVTILEAQTYPGGCAGSFYYQGYRFDAGATLAGGFGPGGPHTRVAERLGLTWPVQPVDPAWVVHLPDGRQVTQWADPARWQAERQAAFPHAERFWRTQERLAEASWDISRRHFPWPPTSARDLASLAAALRPRTAQALPYLGRRLRALLPADDPWLKLFVDANLLISAQATSDSADSLYGSAALDLPRRGVNWVAGGMGGLALTLVDWIRRRGGEVLYRQRVDAIERRAGRVVAVLTNQDASRGRDSRRFACDQVLANLTPWALATLLDEPARQRQVQRLSPTWGAFMLYLGVDAASLPAGVADHHQVIVDAAQPLGEGNSAFISLSPLADSSRAPAGMRAVNISTHTAIEPWWAVRRDPQGQAAYDARRQAYTERLLAAAERAMPGFQAAVRLTLPATPVTYAHWTGRPLGMVGGFPQTSIFQARGPATGLPNLWLVGDSVFPGQSTAGVTLGALRVVETTLGEHRPMLRRGAWSRPLLAPDRA